MRKRCLCLLLAVSLLLGTMYGCGSKPPVPETETTASTTQPVQREPEGTIPPDGSPEDVTCKGSYTSEENGDAVVASVGAHTLTNRQLWAWYWAEAAAWRQAGEETAPDFDRPLDTQECPLDASVATWQQYFLQRALNAWHASQALVLQGEEEGLPSEEAFKPDPEKYEKYMTGMPATRYMYRYTQSYQPNTMHQAFLDDVPTMLETLAGERGYADASEMAREAFGTTQEALEEFTRLYNRGYMYFTSLSYYIQIPEEEIEAYYAQHGSGTEAGSYADVHHILLVPESSGETGAVSVAEDGTVTASEAAWEACMEKARAMLEKWQTGDEPTEGNFADMAYRESQDPGTSLDGGAYRRIRQGQLLPVLDEWCFDQSRQPGDTVILRSQYGCHILYFTGSTPIGYAEAEDALKVQAMAELIRTAREKYPAQIDYSAIALPEADGTVSTGDLLYPDVAHERFPEIPLYLQQDYPGTMFGGFELRTNGCGITSMAMVASYLTDQELTPPMMCARYGKYSFANGTDGMIFTKEPQTMGFYLKRRTFEPTEALEALKEGYIVISIQHKGYWTRGGHYIVLEKVNEDGTVQVRDSNIFNYSRVRAHKEDRHKWENVVSSTGGFWIFEYKIKRIPACSRCGDPEGVTASLLVQDYCCEKCRPALLRRNTYLSACPENSFGQ